MLGGILNFVFCLSSQAEELASLHGLFSWKEHIKIMKANVLLLDRSRRDNFIRGEKLLQALPAEHESSDLSTKEMCKFLYLVLRFKLTTGVRR